ncbi:MAG TPA: hypothetical protein VGF55_14735, partial [Gemmataceae bacterium]
MTSPLSSARVRDLLRELRRLTADRAAAEADTAREYAARSDAARKAFESAKAKLEARHTADRGAADRGHEAAARRANVKADEGLKAARNAHGTAREEALERSQAAEEGATKEYQEAKWTQDAMLEARTKKALNVRDQARRLYAAQVQAAAGLRQEALDQLQKWKLVPPGAGAVEQVEPPADPLPLIEQHVATAHRHVRRLKGLIAPRLLVGDRFLIGCFVAWLGMGVAAYFLAHWSVALSLAIPAAVVIIGGVGLRFALKAYARSQATKIGQPLFRDLAEAERLARIGEEAAESRYRQEVEQAKETHRGEVRTAEKSHRKQLAEVLQSRDTTVKAADDQLAKLTAEYIAARDRELAKVEADHQTKVTAIEGGYEKQKAELTDGAGRQRAEIEAWHTQTFQKLADDWHRGTSAARDALDGVWSQNNRLFPDWSGPAWRGWQPPTGVPAGIRFGELAVDVAALPGGQPADSKLRPIDPDRFTVPALLPFPHRCATLLHATGAARGAAVQALQAMMMRFLTALPPGKVRFTIIDPVGLGENFAAFMHLADYDEQLIGARIWTETAQIEKRLADTTEHMENVIQKYLRNQYSSIEEYNEQAGEVAEPYRVLVVANFPANFSLDAARRLASIAASGASCGVFTLVSVDPRLPLPQGFPLADLEQPSLNLRWRHGHFEWDDPDFSQYPLTLDAPPDPAPLAAIVQTVGAK